MRASTRLILLSAVAGAAIGCLPGRRSVPAPASGSIRILLVNDVYLGDTLRDGSGGLARVAAVRDSLARHGPVLFMLAGDVLSPSLLSKWYRGVQMVEQFNAARLDYATFGNHEFELDRDTLITRVAGSRFRWTSANCMLSSGQPFPRVSRWDTTTVAGMRVGIFGVTLMGDYRSYVRCSDPDSAARNSIAQLEAAGADIIIGLTHQSVSADSALLAREALLHAIVGGHEHEWHAIRIGSRNLLKADANSRSAQLLTISSGPGGWVQQDELIVMDRRRVAQPETEAVVQKWRDTLVKRLGPERVIATAQVALDARDATCRARECNMGDLVTDAIRLGTGADVALMNSGTMRIDDIIPAGPVSNYQIESIFLFADETRIVTFPITGARLRELLEHGVSERAVGRGAYIQVSGVRFRWDPGRASGSRIVGDITRADGRAIRPDETVRVSFNVYPACERGDRYVVPEAHAACANRTGGPRAVDLLVRHISQRLDGQIRQPDMGRVLRLEQ